MDKDTKPDQQIPLPQTQGSAQRPPARLLLEERRMRIQKELQQIQTLLDMMPTNPTPEQEEALFNVYIKLL